MYGVWGYNDTVSQYLGQWNSFANAIAAAGSFMDTGRYSKVTVEIEVGPSVDPIYHVIYTA